LIEHERKAQSISTPFNKAKIINLNISHLLRGHVKKKNKIIINRQYPIEVNQCKSLNRNKQKKKKKLDGMWSGYGGTVSSRWRLLQQLSQSARASTTAGGKHHRTPLRMLSSSSDSDYAHIKTIWYL
jgi:hypothetical protein